MGDKEKEEKEKHKKENKVKITVSSLKENEDKAKNEKSNINNKSEIKEESKKENRKVGFFKTFYYATIRPDKIYKSVESKGGWIKYLLILLLLLSLLMGFSLGNAMFNRTKDFKTKIAELPEFKYKNGKIEGKLDISFLEEGTERLIIINTVDSLFDIRDQYKEEIDKVEQYILLTKDTIYAEPGDSFDFADFNFLTGKTINQEDVVEFLDTILQLKFITYFSGFLASFLILGFISILAFLSGRFIIALLTINSIKTFDFKRINKLTVFLTTMPFIVYVILAILAQFNIFKLPINSLFVFYIIYIAYILITLRILRSKYSEIKVIKNIEDLSSVIEDINKTAIEEMEKQEKKKREERKKLKEKQKKENKDKKKDEKQEDEIVEGA